MLGIICTIFFNVYLRYLTRCLNGYGVKCLILKSFGYLLICIDKCLLESKTPLVLLLIIFVYFHFDIARKSSVLCAQHNPSVLLACQLSIYHFITWSEIGYFKIGFKIIQYLLFLYFFCKAKMLHILMQYFSLQWNFVEIFLCFLIKKVEVN